MWKQGGRRCFLEVTADATLLRVVDATSILREQIVTEDAASLLAKLWQEEDTHDTWHYSTLACA